MLGYQEDGKLLYAYDRARKPTTKPVTEYFLQAIDTVRKNKAQYAQAEASARARHPRRPSFFDSVGMGEMMHLHAVGMSAMSSGPVELIEHDFEG